MDLDAIWKQLLLMLLNFASDPCQNGGSFNLIQFQCVCKPGFEGLICQTIVKTTTTYPPQTSHSTGTTGGPSPSHTTSDGSSLSSSTIHVPPSIYDSTTKKTSTFSEYTSISQSSISTTGNTSISQSSISTTGNTSISQSSISTTGNTSISQSSISTTGNTSISQSSVSSATDTTKLTPDSSCNNHGYVNDGDCDCLEHFFGRRCEFIVDQIRPGLVTVEVTATVTVWNKAYQEDLGNTSSELYKEFVEKFTEEMNLVYIKVEIPSYAGVQHISFSNGSLVVNHMVLLNIYAEEYDKTISDIENIWNNTNCTDGMNTGGWCFQNFTIKKEKQDFTDVCMKYLSIPEDVRHYFVPKNVSGIVTCVSNCSTKSDFNVKCKNGECLLTLQGPSCYCDVSDQYWYYGERCQISISKPGVYGGVAAGLAVLLIIIVALSICLCLRRKRRAPGSLRCRDDRWHEHGWEIDGHGVGAQNPRNARSRFQPTLENVNTDMRANLPRPTSPH